MRNKRESFGSRVAALLVLVAAGLCSFAGAAHAQGSVGFAVASSSPINDTASELCVDEMVEVVRLDGRLAVVPARAAESACPAFDIHPRLWAECQFAQVPTVALRVQTELARGGYMLDVRYVTTSGEVLENRVTVAGELRDLLYRCRTRAAVLVEALFGDIRVSRELLAAHHLLSGTRHSRRWGVETEPGDEVYVWRQYPGDRVGDFRPRRGHHPGGGYGPYTEGRDNRVGDYLPNRSGEYLGPPYLPSGTPAQPPSAGYMTDDYTTYRRAPAAGYFILQGGERAYYDLRPRRTSAPRSDGSDAPLESPDADRPEGRYLESR